MQAGLTQTERDEARRRRGRFRRWWAARPASRLAVVGRATRVQTGRVWHRCRRSARRGWAALWQRLTPSGSADGPENSQQEANISLAFHAIWLVPALLGAAGVVLLFSLTLWPETTQHRSHQQPTTLSQVSISAVEPVPHDGDAGQPPDPFAPEPVRVIKDGVTPVEATPEGATDEMLKQTADLGSNERTPDVGAELTPTTALATSEPPSDLSEKDLPSPTPRGHQPIPDRLAHLPSPASTTEVTRRAPPLPDLDALPQSAVSSSTAPPRAPRPEPAPPRATQPVPAPLALAPLKADLPESTTQPDHPHSAQSKSMQPASMPSQSPEPESASALPAAPPKPVPLEFAPAPEPKPGTNEEEPDGPEPLAPPSKTPANPQKNTESGEEPEATTVRPADGQPAKEPPLQPPAQPPEESPPKRTAGETQTTTEPSLLTSDSSAVSRVHTHGSEASPASDQPQGTGPTTPAASDSTGHGDESRPLTPELAPSEPELSREAEPPPFARVIREPARAMDATPPTDESTRETTEPNQAAAVGKEDREPLLADELAPIASDPSSVQQPQTLQSSDPRRSSPTAVPSDAPPSAGPFHPPLMPEPPSDAATAASQAKEWKSPKPEPGPVAAEPNEPALPAEKSLPAAQAPVTESLPTDEATTADRTEAPKLALQVVAPANAKVGQRYVIVFTIRNVGRVDAKKVVLHVDLPPELSYPYGRLLKYDVGELRAGQSHAARLTARVDRPGRLIIRSRLLLKGHAVQDISSVARAVR